MKVSCDAWFWLDFHRVQRTFHAPFISCAVVFNEKMSQLLSDFLPNFPCHCLQLPRLLLFRLRNDQSIKLACRQRPQVRCHGIWSQIPKRWIESPKVPNRIKSQIATIQFESLMVKSNSIDSIETIQSWFKSNRDWDLHTTAVMYVSIQVAGRCCALFAACHSAQTLTLTCSVCCI